MKRGLLVFLFAVSVPFSGRALSAPKLPPAPSAEELASITARGTMLAEYDQAVWHATDAVQATKPPDGLVNRYIARKTADGWVGDFGRLNADNDKFLVAYEAVPAGVPMGFKVNRFDPEQQDVNFDLVAAKGIELALRDFGGANRPYNVAVLPADAGNLFVYLYPAQVKDGVYPYGGDVRYLIAADGRSIITKRQLHKSVLESVPANTPSHTTVAGGYHTHILSDVPEDTDVFLVLSRRPKIPEMVGAGGRVFEIGIEGEIKVIK